MEVDNNKFYEHLLGRCKQAPEQLGSLDFDEELFTRFMYNLSGQVVGYQTYNWRADKLKHNDARGRYFTWLTKTAPKQSMLGLMGLESLRWGETLYLVEGQFEQATANAYGLNCLAVLCNNPKHLKNWVASYPGKVVALCQDDSAGRDLANTAHDSVLLPKDTDELTKDEVLSITAL